jgi:hypothetical protein
MPSPIPTTTYLTSEETLCLRFFLKAYTAGKYEVDCDDAKQANRIRIQLFRLRKKFLSRPDLQAEYPQFVTPCQDSKISCKPGEAKLTVYRSDSTDFMQRMREKLGDVGDDEPSAGVKAHTTNEIPTSVLQSQKAFMEKVQGEGLLDEKSSPGTFVNPFQSILDSE